MKQLNRLFLTFFVGFLLFFNRLAEAATAPAGYIAPGAVGGGPSLGDATSNLADVFGAFTGVLFDMCYIIGGAMLLGSIILYKNYRDNPSQTRISRPIFFLLIGLTLIGLPFIAQLSQSVSVVPASMFTG